MAGKEKGAAAKFCSETGNEKAVYFHCTSHELNLSLSKASKILQVIVCTIQMLGIFLSTHQNVNKNWKLLLNHFKNSPTTAWNTLDGSAHSIYRSKPVIRMNFTWILSQQLQGSTAEIAQGYEMVSVVTAQLNNNRCCIRI